MANASPRIDLVETSHIKGAASWGRDEDRFGPVRPYAAPFGTARTPASWSGREQFLADVLQPGEIQSLSDARQASYALSHAFQSKCQVEPALESQPFMLSTTRLRSEALTMVWAKSRAMRFSIKLDQPGMFVIPISGGLHLIDPKDGGLLVGGESSAYLASARRIGFVTQGSEFIMVRVRLPRLDAALVSRCQGEELPPAMGCLGHHVFPASVDRLNLGSLLKLQLLSGLHCEQVAGVEPLVDIEGQVYRLLAHFLVKGGPSGRTGGSRLSCDLERLLGYIRGRLDQELTMTELAEFAGLSVRAIQLKFKERLGWSPIQWITNQKLIAARRKLEDPREEDTVTSVAANYFSNLGEFARRYRDLHGELPSQTLSRSRARRRGTG